MKKFSSFKLKDRISEANPLSRHIIIKMASITFLMNLYFLIKICPQYVADADYPNTNNLIVTIRKHLFKGKIQTNIWWFGFV